MINVILVDDEMPALAILKRQLKKFEFVNIVGSFINPIEALDIIETVKPDAVFIDIEMPEINGLEFAEKISGASFNCEIIFVTAYDQYALEAFKANALDYLMKPASSEEILRVVQKIIKRRNISINDIQKSNVRINLFGQYFVQIGTNVKIKWITSKCSELLAYLLFESKKAEVPKWKVLDDLWTDKDEEKAYINLRSTLCRLNKTLKEYNTGIKVVSSRTGYRLEYSKNINVDAFELEQFALDIHGITVDNYKKIEEVLLKYKGELLENIGSVWCENLREKYRRYFINLAAALLEYYADDGIEGLKNMNVVETILKYNTYNEEIIEKTIKLQYKINGRKAAERYYNKLCDNMEMEIGVLPDRNFKEIINYSSNQT